LKFDNLKKNCWCVYVIRFTKWYYVTFIGVFYVVFNNRESILQSDKITITLNNSRTVERDFPTVKKYMWRPLYSIILLYGSNYFLTNFRLKWETENNEVKIIWCKAHAYISSYWGWMTKFLFTRSKFSIKNLVKVYFDKVLRSCRKPASKTLSKNFDGLCRNKNPSYFSKTVVGFWREVTIFSESRSNSAVLFVFELTTEM